ncbi:MAG: hypothetical protein ACYDAC_06670 [Candidatus Dormibacteria bacterium]
MSSVPRSPADGVITMHADMPAGPGGDLIARAGHEIWERRTDARRSRADANRVRQRVTAIDSFISVLEERHLTGDRVLDRVLRQRLQHLEAEVGLPLPRKAVRARNTVRLHAALLDWQEEMLDALLPERLAFADVHDDDWATATPLGWQETGTD